MPGLLLHHETRTKDYNHDMMEPWVHYVPVSSDLSDLREKYEWAESHPDKARHIAERATALARAWGTKEAFRKMFEEHYARPLSGVVGAYRPLEGPASWRDVIGRRGGGQGNSLLG